MSRQLIGKNRKSTRYRVTYPTLPSFQVQPELLELKQAAGQHDVMVIQYASNRGDYFKELKTGVPVQVSWSQGARSRVWYGYVSVTKVDKSNQTTRPTKVYCVGPSFLMKDSSPKVFKNKTIPEVAEIIAKQFSFQFVGENHSSRFDQLTISGDTYWEWLQDAAKSIGYACYVDEMKLVFRPIGKVIEQNKTDVPIMQFWTLPVPNKQFGLDRTLDSFELLSGEYVEGEDPTRSEKQIGGVNPVTNRAFITKRSPDKTGKSVRGDVSGVLFKEHQVGGVANSSNWAKVSSQAAAISAKFNLPAKAIGQGDPRIHPFSMVYLDGTGASTDGAWLVRAVTHTLNRGGEYSVMLDIASDGLGNSAVDYSAGLKVSSSPVDRSIVGKIDLEKYLSSRAFSSSSSEGTTTVKLPSKGRDNGNTTSLKSKVDVNKLIQKKITTAKPGLAKSPHAWRSNVPGNSLRKRKAT